MTFLLTVEHPNNDNLPKWTREAGKQQRIQHSTRISLFFIYKAFVFLSFETKQLHSHTNFYKSNLWNTIPLIKQGTRPSYVVVSLGRLCSESNPGQKIRSPPGPLPSLPRSNVRGVFRLFSGILFNIK